jgi:6-phosphogluconolactonase
LVPGVADRIRIFDDLPDASAALSRELLARARIAVAARGVFSLVLAGGRTPVGLYKILGGELRSRFPWRATQVYFGDERCVPPTHPDSNFGAAWEALLSRVPIPRHAVHRLRGELRPPSVAAARYDRRLGPLGSRVLAGSPRFDVVLLGLGPDGHTASVFPGAPAARETRRGVVAVPHPGVPPIVPRLTLTPPALSSTRALVFLVAGSDKARAVAATLGVPPPGDVRYPASLLRPDGPTTWFLDREAAAGRDPTTTGRGIG